MIVNLQGMHITDNQLKCIFTYFSELRKTILLMTLVVQKMSLQRKSVKVEKTMEGERNAKPRKNQGIVFSIEWYPKNKHHIWYWVCTKRPLAEIYAWHVGLCVCLVVNKGLRWEYKKVFLVYNRPGSDIVDSDDEEDTSSKARRKPKKKQVKESVEGLSAKQKRKVVSKATISDTDSSDSGGDVTGTGQNTAASTR